MCADSALCDCGRELEQGLCSGCKKPVDTCVCEEVCPGCGQPVDECTC